MLIDGQENACQKHACRVCHNKLDQMVTGGKKMQYKTGERDNKRHTQTNERTNTLAMGSGGRRKL